MQKLQFLYHLFYFKAVRVDYQLQQQSGVEASSLGLTAGAWGAYCSVTSFPVTAPTRRPMLRVFKSKQAAGRGCTEKLLHFLLKPTLSFCFGEQHLLFRQDKLHKIHITLKISPYHFWLSHRTGLHLTE